MSLASEVAGAFLEAQALIAQIQGMAAAAAGNFIGPDGRPYTMVFASVDGLTAQASGFEMQSHGFGDKSFVTATATRSQFPVAPLGWRRQKATRLIPAPATECLILSIATDDPIHYVFTLALRQPDTSNG